jgi:spore photoproduct lyase
MIQEKIHKGPFIKHCPCSPGAVSCGYFNLNLHTGCPYDCTYCILQDYLEDKTQAVFYTNVGDLEAELREFSRNRKHIRIGTGELTDSLAFEGKVHYAARILKLAEEYPRIVFEFKTKSDRIGPILAARRPLKNVVVSWSMNPQPIIETEERKTPGLRQRLEALAAVQKKGFLVGIHFDPLLIFPGWKARYLELIRAIRLVIDPSRVAWWSLGALRFPPSLKRHIFRHRQSILFAGELVPGFDGKYRYFKPLRRELFSHVRRTISSQVSSGIPVYLCMEDDEMWREILPSLPPDEKRLNRFLYDSVMGK